MVMTDDSCGEYSGHLNSATRRCESSSDVPGEDLLGEKGNTWGVTTSTSQVWAAG
ncbi:hypothetical protein HMPREF9621_00223 [Cutibacterium modestum HL037PA2]|nr:hypothetical protein HMPREF9621_00223 [Cutibacterium modestum HL037PA2]